MTDDRADERADDRADDRAEPGTRRERLRQQLTTEIKQTALRQLTVGGPQAVSLRGIAREVGVSPAALYGYFASLDDLVTALVVDGFTLLAEAVEEAVATHAGEPVQDRLIAGLFAYRQWALDHPDWFRLLYCNVVPDWEPPADGSTVAADLRVSAAFLVVLAEAWASGQLPEPEPGLELDCSKFREHFGLEITPDQMRTAVSCWAQFHGFVSLEVNGHVGVEWCDPAALYDAAMRTMLVKAGLPRPSEAITPVTVAAELGGRPAVSPA